MSLIERIYQLSDFKGDSIYKISKEIGVSNGYFAKTRAKKGSVGGDIIEKIVSYYSDLNIDWLITGAGEILKSKNQEKTNILNVSNNVSQNVEKQNIKKKLTNELHFSISDLLGETKNGVKVIKQNDNLNDNQNDNKRNIQDRLSFENTSLGEPDVEYPLKRSNKIPFYDCVSISGSRSVADMTAITQPAEYIDPGDLFRDADAGMRTYEDSMLEYPSGCAIFLKEVRNKELVVFGNDYVIETSEYRVTKRLQRSLLAGYWTLASTNMEIWHAGPLEGRLIHEPFDVNIDHVFRIFKVLGVTTRTGSSKILMNNGLKKN
jgi:hypothetical protein